MKNAHTFLLMLLLPLLQTSLMADDNPASPCPQIGRLAAHKVLFLGNSITLHGPALNIGWSGNWGMAASGREKDYVHLVTAEITAASGAEPTVMVKNIADFEREYEAFDAESVLKSELDFQADMIIIAIGENVAELTTNDAKSKFTAAFGRLIRELQKHGQPAIFVRSSFWANPVKDEIMRKVAEETNAKFIDLMGLDRNEANMARSERRIEHTGVAAHPGDQGMKAIADAIFAAIRNDAGLAKSGE
jgi:lysophospholipase L1-like esterase